MNQLKNINKKQVSGFLFDHVVEIMLIILVIVMSNVSKTFNTTANWLNIFRNMSMKGLIAFGMTMVIISGQIDLSIGSTVALSGVIVARCCRDLPGRKIGICRAYVAKAMECGLDAGIVNTGHRYGEKEVDAELLKLIEAYAALDGSMERLNDAMTLMGQFCASCKKA